MQRRGAILLESMIGGREQLVQVHAGAEVAARAAHGNHANARVEIRLFQRREQRIDHRGIDRVALIGAVERRSQHTAGNLHDDAIAHLRTSISMRRSAVEKTLPCASVFREIVPPPSSAPCSRKFSAERLGSSKRSTLPVIMPLKCRATRAAVTCFTSSG